MSVSDFILIFFLKKCIEIATNCYQTLSLIHTPLAREDSTISLYCRSRESSQKTPRGVVYKGRAREEDSTISLLLDTHSLFLLSIRSRDLPPDLVSGAPRTVCEFESVLIIGDGDVKPYYAWASTSHSCSTFISFELDLCLILVPFDQLRFASDTIVIRLIFLENLQMSVVLGIVPVIAAWLYAEYLHYTKHSVSSAKAYVVELKSFFVFFFCF